MPDLRTSLPCTLSKTPNETLSQAFALCLHLPHTSSHLYPSRKPHSPTRVVMMRCDASRSCSLCSLYGLQPSHPLGCHAPSRTSTPKRTDMPLHGPVCPSNLCAHEPSCPFRPARTILGHAPHANPPQLLWCDLSLCVSLN